MKRTFLAVYDYGQGGIWLLIDANSVTEIEQKYQGLKAYEDKPSWMTDSDKTEYFQSRKKIGFHWDVDNPTGWLFDYLNKN